MIRFIFILVLGAVLASCGSNKKIDYSDRLDSEDFFSEEEKIRLEKLKINQATIYRMSGFVFDEDEHLVYLCNYEDCGRFQQEDGYTINLNRDGSYSSFKRLLGPNELQICGKGDAFKHLDRKDLWRTLGLQRSRAYMGNKDWSAEDPLFCNHPFTKVEAYNDVMELLMGSISDLSYKVHIRRPDPDALKAAIIVNQLDMFILQFSSNKSGKQFGDYRVIEYETDNLQDVLQEQLKQPINVQNRHDGIVFFNTGSTPIVTPLSFKAGADNDQLLEILNELSKSLVNTVSTGKENSAFISRFIPPKVSKPVMPTLTKLEKGEFEKQRDFELRASDYVAKKERDVHQLVQNYNFKVFSRNEYVKALTTAYHDYLNKQTSLAAKDRQVFNENLGLVSRVIFQSLYSDLTATSFNYDAETERLYISLSSPRNKFKERVVVKLKPEIAKQIKWGNDYQLSLNVTVKENKLTLPGVYVHQSGERYSAAFTKSQFKPMRLVMKEAAPKKVSLREQQADYSKWLQKDTDLGDNINRSNFYLSLKKNYNLNLPKWFVNPCADCVTFKGETVNEALSSARAELSRRKQVRVAARETVKKEMFESSSGVSGYSGSYAETVSTETSAVLTRNDYTVTKQEEIDGLWYVELKFL